MRLDIFEGVLTFGGGALLLAALLLSARALWANRGAHAVLKEALTFLPPGGDEASFEKLVTRRSEPRPSADHLRAVRIRLDLSVRQNEDDLAKGGGGIGHRLQPAPFKLDVVAHFDGPDVEA